MIEAIAKSNRELILDFQEMISNTPGAKFGDMPECPLKHSFAEGVYVREIFIPAGMFLVGKIHKHCHPNFLMSGKVSVFTEEEGQQTLEGPLSMISKAGTKRAVYAHTDTVWITVHVNPTDTQDLDELEEIVIAKDFNEYEEFRRGIIKEQEATKQIKGESL